MKRMKIVTGISIFCSLMWMSAVFAGNIVSLTVSTTNASIVGEWDNLSGQGAALRYIKVNASGVELGSDGSVSLNMGNNLVVIEKNDSSDCNARCTLNPNSPQHKVQITGTYSTGGSGSGGKKPTWDATGYTKANIELTIDVPPAVRRKYGANDPKNTVTIFTVKGTKDIVFTLTIEKLSGIGEASFEDGKKTKEHKGTGAAEPFNIIGLEESTVATNIKMTGTYDNKEYAKDTFIVFSEIEFEFNSAETQHKDTAASCGWCILQENLVYLSENYPWHVHYATKPDYEEVQPCDHRNANPDCEHCSTYCARCCLKVKYGGSQDDYLELDPPLTTVEDNHGEGLTMTSIRYYAEKKGGVILGIIYTPEYADIYNKIKKDHSCLTTIMLTVPGSSVAHEIITHGCRNNKADGTITEPEIYYWDPAPATNDWRKIKSEYSEVCEILYVR